METNPFISGILLIILFVSCKPDNSDVGEIAPTKNYLANLKPLPTNALSEPTNAIAEPISVPTFPTILTWFDKHNGHTETYANRSKQIDIWNIQAGVAIGSFWCGSYAAAAMRENGYKHPNAPAWSPSWAIKSRKVNNPQLADAFTVHFNGRVRHVGLIREPGEIKSLTSEGNSNNNGSNNGDRVVQKWRIHKTISFYRWVN